MSIVLTVNNIPFEYPEQGEQAPWGEAATGWAQEVTKVLGSLSGPSDILETSDVIANGQTTFLNIVGLFFNSTTVRSFKVSANVTRAYVGGEITEYIELIGLNQGSGWVIQQEGIGDAGITIDIDSTGQLQYKSTTLSGQTSGIIKFRGIGLLKV